MWVPLSVGHSPHEGWNFFDNDGNLVRQQLEIREDNTVTNLDTGPTLREGPDPFMQRTIFNPDGSVAELIATGLAANVRGDEGGPVSVFRRRRV